MCDPAQSRTLFIVILMNNFAHLKEVIASQVPTFDFFQNSYFFFNFI